MNLAKFDKYQQWKDKHPYLFEQFEAHALRFIARDQKFSFRDLAGHIRWSGFFDGSRAEPYKLSHTYTPYIARDLCQMYPALNHLITTRPVREEITV